MHATADPPRALRKSHSRGSFACRAALFAALLAAPAAHAQAPTGLTASRSGDTVTIRWTAVENATGYKIRWQRLGREWLNPNGAAGVELSATITGHNIDFSALPEDQTYNIQAAATVQGVIFWSKGLLLSTDATLQSLRLSLGALTPEFDPATVSYTAEVSDKTAGIRLTPVLGDPGAVIRVAGKIVASGAPSDVQALSTGENPIDISVTANEGEANENVNTYRVTVTRLRSPDSALSGLTLSDGKLLPDFQPAITDYTAVVAHSTAGITLTPHARDPNARIRVEGAEVNSGGASPPQALEVGANMIEIVVTAQDEAAATTYALSVTRTAQGGGGGGGHWRGFRLRPLRAASR